jgi:hypothetical protein
VSIVATTTLGAAPESDGLTEAAWTEALDAAAELRAALETLGLASDFTRLRGDVNVYGEAHVSLGRVPPTTARLLALVLRGLH